MGLGFRVRATELGLGLGLTSQLWTFSLSPLC